MRLVPRRVPRLLPPTSRILEEEEEFVEDRPGESPKRDEPDELSGLAFVLDLASKTMEAGPGSQVWLEAAKGPEVVDGLVRVSPGWTDRAAAMADLVVLLSESTGALVERTASIRKAAADLERRRPLILVGKFKDDERDAFDALAEARVDGVVLEHRDLGEAEIEAELLRRGAANLAERLMLERGTWTYAPAICVTGRLDVLALLPSTLAEFSLMDRPPRERRDAPGGRLLVLEFPESRVWWAEDFLVVGPSRLVWSKWARDPRVPP